MNRQIRRGNPLKLTKHQHVLARKSIARFAGVDGRVEVWFRQRGGIQRCRPDQSIFWTYRGWDQPAERNAKTHIEDRFQALAESILGGKRELSSPEKRLIAQFQQLWALRFAVKEFPRTDVELPASVPPGQTLSQATQENLEANGYSFVTSNRIPGPQLAGLVITAGLLRSSRAEAVNTEWSVVTSGEIEFLVPDSFRAVRTVPLSPNCCLLAIPGGARELTALEAVHLNNMAIGGSVHYAFAREFSKTGIALQASIGRPRVRPQSAGRGRLKV